MFVDTHCHLSVKDYENIEDIISNMKDNILIVSGVNDETNKEVVSLCLKYNNVYGTIGYHPEEVLNFTKEGLKYIEDNLNNPKIVGIGEIGLDYYWDKSHVDQQKEMFIEQINLANKYNKTIVIHSREATIETYDILKKYSKTKIVIHCYSSSLEMANRYIELGAMLGIGGVLTFKNSVKLKEVVENIDMKHLLLETDSPYLSPEPFRGKKNEPANAYYVALKIAEIKNESIENVLETTTKNAFLQFDLRP